MTGDVCLQGGAELQPGCEPMDRAMLTAAAGAPRRVLVAPFAGRPGRERTVAGANAERWYRGLGALEVDVVTDEGDAFGSALALAELLVLPGGSPTRLLDALEPHADLLRSAVGRGLAVSGSSAGAMVLCRWAVLPDDGRRVAPALALAPVDLVLVHYRGDTGWLDVARPHLPDRPVVLGIPERSGVLLRADGSRRDLGVARCTTSRRNARCDVRTRGQRGAVRSERAIATSWSGSSVRSRV